MPRQAITAQQLAEDRQKAWATLVDLLKIIITLSAAIVGSWALVFSDPAKMPVDWKKWLLGGAIVFAGASIVAALVAIMNINRQIVEIVRGGWGDANTRWRRLIIASSNASLWSFMASGSLVTLYMFLRIISPPTTNSVSPQIDMIISQINARIKIIENTLSNLKFGYNLQLLSNLHIGPFNIDVKSGRQNIAIFKPQLLKKFSGFELGSSVLTPQMVDELHGFCEGLDPRNTYENGFLLVIGSADRVLLGAAAQLQFESNFNLAQARAEEIKSRLENCGVSVPILALPAGASNTGQRSVRPPRDLGTPEDRRVEVWGFGLAPSGK